MNEDSRVGCTKKNQADAKSRFLMRSSDNSLYVSRDVTGRGVLTMYATRLLTDIYHLVQPGRHHTLCGLRISRVTLERKTTTLQLVSELPGNQTICKHCERIRTQDGRG